jgi:elongation factor P
MKEAIDCKPGQIIKKDGALYVVRAWYPHKIGDRGGIVVDMKIENLDTGNISMIQPRSQDKFDDVILERKQVQYSYQDGGMYVFIDKNTFDQVEINSELLGDNLGFLKENMELDIFFHEGRAVSVVFPTFVEMEISYTENVVRGDTSGKVLKKAKMEDSGLEIDVPSFCNIGDKIKIDTRTHEYVERVK